MIQSVFIGVVSRHLFLATDIKQVDRFQVVMMHKFDIIDLLPQRINIEARWAERYGPIAAPGVYCSLKRVRCGQISIIRASEYPFSWFPYPC